MNKIFFFLLLFIAIVNKSICFAQTKDVTEVSVGNGSNYTNQPIHAQSDFSHSQVLYYPLDLKFKGEINEIRYRTVFYKSSFENSTKWVVKISHTDLDDFDNRQGFIPNTELTEVFNGEIEISGYEIIIKLDKPFYYDGKQNLVIDVEEFTEGKTESNLTSFTGLENFNNPPKRSFMSFTKVNEDKSESKSFVKENSYPSTKFIGNLKRCIVPHINFTEGIKNITETTAEIHFTENENITIFKYKVTLANETNNLDYISSTENKIYLENLLPARDYKISYKSNCDEIPSESSVSYFTTKKKTITLPHSINFNDENIGDYLLEKEDSFYSYASTHLLNVDNDKNNKAIVLKGGRFLKDLGWSNSENKFTYNNSRFKSSINFDIDLTNNPTKPIFNFDVKQIRESYIRVLINNKPLDFIYKSFNGNIGEFKTVSIDLKRYINQKIILKIEHVADGGYLPGETSTFPNGFRITFIDNIELKENTCLVPENILLESDTSSIDVKVEPSNTEFELFYAEFDTQPGPRNLITFKNSYKLENLEVATSYDVFVRTKCNDDYSPFIKNIISTEPNLITVPHQKYFRSGISDGLYAPIYNLSSEKLEYIFYGVGLYQKDIGLEWIGGDNTTEFEAWNDNKDFITGLKFKVDLRQISDADLDLRFLVTSYVRSVLNTSWFRVLINNKQYGNSFNAIYDNGRPTYQNLNINLSEYEGEIVEIILEQSGQDDSFCQGCSYDGVLINNLKISGEKTLGIEESIQKNQISIYPNPANNLLSVTSRTPINQLNIYNLNGRLIMNKKIENTLETQFKVSNLSKGIYLLEIKSGNKKHFQKLIIE